MFLKTALILSVCFTFPIFALDPKIVAIFQQRIRTAGKNCLNEIEATMDDLKQLLDHQVPDSHEGKCLIYCFHKHFQIQNDDGSLNEEGALATLDVIKDFDTDLYSKVYEVFDSCFKTVTPVSDPCETAGLLAGCGIRKAAELGIDGSIME